MTLPITAVVFFLLSFVGTRLAMAEGESLSELAGPIYDAIMGGQYAYAAALAVVLVVAMLRRYGGARWPALSHKLVAPLLVFAASFAGSLATAFAAGEAVGSATLWPALKIAVMGAGGYAMLKPYFTWLSGKAPAWARPLFGILDAIFSARSKAAKVAAAKAAGDAAVAANPSKGPNVDFTTIK